MVIAWPLGLGMATVFYLIPHPWFLSCPRGDFGACESSILTWLVLAFWVLIGVGPGLMATAQWRRARSAATRGAD